MHFTEVFSEIKKMRQNDLSIKDRNVHAILSSLPSVLLWDRVTFIHNENAVFPYSLIRKVEEWLNAKLEQNIPFVSVHGAFREYQGLCIHKGIPSGYALYSCLKISGEQLLAFPHFPFVYLKKPPISDLNNLIEFCPEEIIKKKSKTGMIY